MAGTVYRSLAEWLIVGLILFSLAVEVLLHKLEHWVAHKHAHLQSVLRNLYRELMILGMVSFGFILYIFIADPHANIKMTFEVAHVFIFLFAIFHTFVVMCTVFMSLRLSARWKTLERMELVKYLEKKEKYRKVCDRIERHKSWLWRNFSWWMPKVSRTFKYWNLHEVMSFHDTRFQFIYYRNLPPDFRFSSFLRKIKSATFIELVEIHWSQFLCFLGFVLLDLARTPLNWSPNFEPSFLIGHSIFNIFFVSFLAVKIRRVYWQMTKNPATYYDAVDRRAFEEELLIAEEEARIEMESQPGSRRMSRATRDGNDTPKAADDDMRKSVDMDRPRTSTSRISTDFVRNQRAKANAPTHPGVNAKAHQPIYANMTHAASGHSSGTATPGGAEMDITQLAARHSLDMQKEATLDVSKVKTPSAGGSYSNRPSARSSFDKPRSYVPTLNNEDGTMSMDAVSRAAMRRRSQETGGGSGARDTDRVSLDGGRMTPLGFRSSLEGRRVSNVSSQKRRFSTDGRRDSSASRRSIELSETLPTEELASRTANSKDIEKRSRRGAGNVPDDVSVDLTDDDFAQGKLEGMSSFRSRTRQEAIRRLQEKKRPIASIVKNAQDLKAAEDQTPSGNYPAWVVKCLPRLGRVASPAEKLFWFGSHRFFMWCVEWVLFFTTVNISATLAKVGFAIKKRVSPEKYGTSYGGNSPYGKKPSSATARMVDLADSMMRQTGTNTAGTGAAKAPAAAGAKKTATISDESFMLLLVALLVGFVALFYVLVRIAGIMKKYIFVLNNANMLPENMTIQAIQNVRVKNLLHGDHEIVYDGGSDTELDEDESAQQRRNLSSFFNNEVEGGHMPGVSTGAAVKRRISISSRRTSTQEGAQPVEAVASHSMDGSATAEAMWQQQV